MNIIIKILILILFVTGALLFLINQRKNIKEWLLYAVIEAEKSLGSKMGQVKLRQVYDDFIFTFPVVSKLIAFNTFSKMVDISLEEMKKILNSNKRVKEYIEGEILWLYNIEKSAESQGKQLP